jgi:glycosyltransferase involved in cell wall biosynthesis
VLLNAYALGGTTRTVINQANVLCADHDVEIASVYRSREVPGFTIDPRVRLMPLTDLRPDGTHRGDPVGAPPRLLDRTRRFASRMPHRHDRRFRRWDPQVDVRILRYLQAERDGVLVTTRPGLNLLSARFAPRRLIRVAQDHMNLSTYKLALRDAILRAYPRFDAVTVLTETDRQEYRRALGPGVRIERIPNGVPQAVLPPAPLTGTVLVAAGRLLSQKGFDLLIDAFRLVHDEHPDWQLRIFGAGPWRQQLTEQIERLGLTGSAHLPGQSEHLHAELAAASMFVLSSRFEGLPMVLLEAMTAGLPTVAFDCPTGPGEVIEHGSSGLLIPPQDVAALAAGIGELIDDPARRRAMGQAARMAAGDYSIATVGRQWAGLVADLAHDRTRRPVRRGHANGVTTTAG